MTSAVGAPEPESLPSAEAPSHTSVVRERIVQAAVALLAAVPLVVFSTSQMISYDGYWHVFIAIQRNWDNFWYEIRQNAHPPLYFVLLGRAMAFGKTAIVYRATSILASIGSTYLVGRIVRRSGASLAVSALISVAFAISLSTLLVGVEVRSYLLGVFFCLVAVQGFFELAAQGFGEASRAARLSFAMGMLLALLTHYSSAFVLAACMAAPILVAVMSRAYRVQLAAGLWRTARTNILTAAPPVVGLLAVAAHSVLASGRLNHVPEFMRDPTRESVIEFLERQGANLAVMFAPFATTRSGQIWGASILVAIMAIVATWRRRYWPGALFPILLPALMLASMALAGVMASYPFGGELRHQYVLFPFMIVGLGVAVSLAIAEAGAVWRRLAVSALAAAVVWHAVVAVRTFPAMPGRLFQRQMDVFRHTFPSARAVYVDRFNLIAFFMHYDDWHWQFAGRTEGTPTIDLWQVTRGSDAFAVCLDLRTWMVQLAEPTVYEGMNRCRRMARVDAVTLFGLEQPSIGAPLPTGADASALLKARAHEAGLQVDGLELDRGSVFAQFSAEHADAQARP